MQLCFLIFLPGLSSLTPCQNFSGLEFSPSVMAPWVCSMSLYALVADIWFLYLWQQCIPILQVPLQLELSSLTLCIYSWSDTLLSSRSPEFSSIEQTWDLWVPFGCKALGLAPTLPYQVDVSRSEAADWIVLVCFFRLLCRSESAIHLLGSLKLETLGVHLKVHSPSLDLTTSCQPNS